MTARDKVISLVEDAIEIVEKEAFWTIANGLRDALALLKEQEKQKFFVDENGEITPLPVVVRCKDCKYGEPWGVLIGCGTSKGFGITHNPDWFCADGEKRTD